MSEPSQQATTPARRRAPKGRGPELYGEVLAAAMDLLRESGDESAMSLRAVAARVGVSVPSIYLHFADKQALLDAVCEEVFDQLHEAMQQATAGARDPFDALHRQGVAYVHFALANPEHYRIVFTPRPASPDGPVEEDLEIATGAFGHLLASIEECLAAGVFVGEPVEIGVRLWAAAHGVASLLISKPSFPWPEQEAFIADTIRMAALGLAVTARPGLERDLRMDELLRRLEQLRAEPESRG